jgi:hypothetical protein
MCTPVTPAVPYLLLGLQDVQWAVGNNRGARKLARTPHVNKKKIARIQNLPKQGLNSFKITEKTPPKIQNCRKAFWVLLDSWRRVLPRAAVTGGA